MLMLALESIELSLYNANKPFWEPQHFGTDITWMNGAVCSSKQVSILALHITTWDNGSMLCLAAESSLQTTIFILLWELKILNPASDKPMYNNQGVFPKSYQISPLDLKIPEMGFTWINAENSIVQTFVEDLITSLYTLILKAMSAFGQWILPSAAITLSPVRFHEVVRSAGHIYAKGV